MNANPPEIQIRGLTKSFADQIVLAGIDLDIVPGRNTALLGVSGSGKTVLMKCILGLLSPDAGSIKIDGRETVALPRNERFALMRETGVLFQNGALFDSLPVWQNIAFSLFTGGRRSRSQARAVALAALADVGLGEETADLSPSEISGGMQKRVALARALVGNPRFLFLDNPTSGLDPVMTAIIDSLVAASVRRLRATALTITHDLLSVGRLTQRAAYMADGRILWQGATPALWAADLEGVRRFVEASGEPRPGALAG